MGCGIEPRKIRYRRGRESLFARRQQVRRRYARCWRPAGVKGHITCKGIASEPGRSRVWPSVSSGCRVRWSASGRRGAEADDARTREVGPRHSTMKPANKAKEAHCGGVCGGERSGVGGAKGGGQGEYAPAQHVLDPEPGSRDKRAGAYTATFAVTHPRWEPYAGKPHVRIWAGGRAMKRTSLPLRRRQFITLIGG